MANNSRFLTGHPLMDQDHQAIFSLLHDISSASRKNVKGEIQPMLDQLRALVAQNIKRENALMLQLNTPSTRGHIREHAEILETMDSIFVFQQDVHPSEMVSLLKEWVQGHILHYDKELAAALQEATDLEVSA